MMFNQHIGQRLISYVVIARITKTFIVNFTSIP